MSAAQGEPTAKVWYYVDPQVRLTAARLLWSLYLMSTNTACAAPLKLEGKVVAVYVQLFGFLVHFTALYIIWIARPLSVRYKMSAMK